jgi:hypothetical protein
LRRTLILQIKPDLEPRRLDGLDASALDDGGVRFLLRPRPLQPRLLVAEALKEQPTARLRHRRQSIEVAELVVVGTGNSETDLVTLRQLVFPAVRHMRRHLPFIAEKWAAIRE